MFTDGELPAPTAGSAWAVNDRRRRTCRPRETRRPHERRATERSGKDSPICSRKPECRPRPRVPREPSYRQRPPGHRGPPGSRENLRAPMQRGINRPRCANNCGDAPAKVRARRNVVGPSGTRRRSIFAIRNSRSDSSGGAATERNPRASPPQPLLRKNLPGLQYRKVSRQPGNLRNVPIVAPNPLCQKG